MAENLSCKKKARAAHQVSVTWMIAQAQELLSSEDGLEPAKLKQKWEALAAKAKFLNKLDTDIIEAVDKGELEEINGLMRYVNKSN